jgi:hypothetical protein
VVAVLELLLPGNASSLFAVGAAPRDILPDLSCCAWSGNSDGSESSLSELLILSMSAIVGCFD